MTHLLDTDHVSILERRGGVGYAPLVANLNLHPVTDVGISVVTVQEQFRGAHARINQATTPAELVRGYAVLLRVIEEFRRFPLVAFDVAAATESDRLKALKLRISTMDRRIAATALAHNLVVVTRNVSDFGKVPGLRTEDWTR
jgi:tRNA(fMet)-specific endonuclease VapC